jgi:hypothetical protein
MIPHRSTLLEARKIYSECARKVEMSIAQQSLTDVLSAQVIGIGIAAEWIRRAAEMDNINYIGKNLNKSRKNELFVEILRFSFSWFALNAIFSRTELLNLFQPPSNLTNEYSKFCHLYNISPLPNALMRLEELHIILNTTIQTRLPNTSSQSVTILEAIHKKYLPSDLGRGNARSITQAVRSGNANGLDMPTLLYAFRNWSVHGNTLDGCFGSRSRFSKYCCLLQETLAEVHYNTAQKLDSLL